jgi:glutaredoxin 2
MGLPELYVYDHCPFCVRVRVALGVTGVPHKLVFLGNDDVETPSTRCTRTSNQQADPICCFA